MGKGFPKMGKVFPKMSRVKKRIEKNYIRYAAQTPFPKMGKARTFAKTGKGITFPKMGMVRREYGEFICSV